MESKVGIEILDHPFFQRCSKNNNNSGSPAQCHSMSAAHPLDGSNNNSTNNTNHNINHHNLISHACTHILFHTQAWHAFPASAMSDGELDPDDLPVPSRMVTIWRCKCPLGSNCLKNTMP